MLLKFEERAAKPGETFRLFCKSRQGEAFPLGAAVAQVCLMLAKYSKSFWHFDLKELANINFVIWGGLRKRSHTTIRKSHKT